MSFAEIPPKVVRLCRQLRVHGFEAWIVGGAVRDLLMSRVPHDWDIATNARPEQVQRIFPRCIPTGIEHGTITVVDDGEHFEVTTFRGDSTYSDGRRPDSVKFEDTIEADLARRDFTMNAVAYDPLVEIFSDPFHGITDIECGVIRAVGNPAERFSEDGLRVLRATRFAATLGFNLHSDTQAAIPGSLSTYRNVSLERIRDEWLKAMSAEKPSIAFQLMLDTGILGATVPEFLDLVGCKQNRFHEYDVWGHTMSTLDSLPKGDAILRVGGLFHDIGKPATKCFQEKTQDYSFYDHDKVGAEMTSTILSKLRFSTEERLRVRNLVDNHMIHYESSWSDSAVRRWVRKVTPELMPSLFVLARADILGKGQAKTPMDQAVIDELQRRVEALEAAAKTPTSTNALAINGRDIMQTLGIKPGPEVGKILGHLLDIVVDSPEKNEREVLLDLSRSVYSHSAGIES